MKNYWQWAYSDILENVQRGVFAEYLVAEALGIVEQDRKGWLGYDLDYKGHRIEVKASGYLQSWPQRRVSRVVFGCGARRQLMADEITYEADPRYIADVYIFAIFTDTDAETANILDASRWAFFVLPTHQLQRLGLKTISEKRLRDFGPAVEFSALRQRIETALSNCKQHTLADLPAVGDIVEGQIALPDSRSKLTP